MLLEEQRFLHEDIERLESAICDRALEETPNRRDKLIRDHEISDFLNRLQDQSRRLQTIYEDQNGARAREIQAISVGDPFDEFYKQMDEIRDFHKRYPNEPVENLEKAYIRKRPHAMIDGDDSDAPFLTEVDRMFSGEEAYGRYFDLTELHERYVNLPGARHITYIQYLDQFDTFTPPQCPIKRTDKLKDEYFHYTGDLASYLEGFMRRTKPLEELDAVFANFDKEFEQDWEADKCLGWSSQAPAAEPTGTAGEMESDAVWCEDCKKQFKNENVYKAHLTGKKHIKAAEARKSNGVGVHVNGGSQSEMSRLNRLKERAVAEREHRTRKLAAAMQTERSDTRVNVERRQGMTERERQQEIQALYAEALRLPALKGGDVDPDGDEEDRIHNPLKLPLGWDGRPIPYWFYKLCGLGVEFACEICGNHVYMGRRAFDKHFNEPKHIHGLKCLGITATSMFREITDIDDAQKLWAKLQADKKKEKANTENVVQMEDSEGNVMPEKVYYDLQKQGLV